MIILLDNYDSFTFNLARFLRELGQQVYVIANDVMTVAQVCELQPQALVISPGPGRPLQAGIAVDLVKTCKGHITILGVCLGHQVINEAFGGRTIAASQIMHGGTSQIYHCDTGLFAGLAQAFQVARYHSLTIDSTQLSNELKICAWTLDQDNCVQDIMAIAHTKLAIYGVQFHPEAILSEWGQSMLSQFCMLAGLQSRHNRLDSCCPDLLYCWN